MNDSFLEELEPILKQSKKTIQEQVDCHVTTRRAATSSPLLEFSEQDERDNATRPQKKHSITGFSTFTGNKDSLKDSKKQSDQNIKKLLVNAKAGEKTEKILDSKGRPAEIKIKIENKQHNINEEQKVKLQEARYLKVPENKVKNKDHIRRSGSHKETIHSLNTSGKENRRSLDSSNHSFDASSKENSRPPDSVKEGTSIKEKEKVPNKSRKSGFKIQDQDPVGLLTAIKELISTYTKQESTKILRAMEELHVNSQTTLIKNLLNQTDDLIKEMHSCKDSARLKTLIEENEQLQQELAALRVQNEDQQNKLEFLKQENAALKLKCHELT